MDERRELLRWKLPLKYAGSNVDSRILDADDQFIFEMRGWGFLTSPNCMGLSPEEAAAVQDARAQVLIDGVNARTVAGQNAKPDGVQLIAEERKRQMEVEGWTPEHDDEHSNGELALAAVCYAYPAPRPLEIKKLWPWDWEWWKPTPPELTEHPHGREQAGDPIFHSIEPGAHEVAAIRDLTKAGALIAAEIDRLQRTEAVASTRDDHGSRE